MYDVHKSIEEILEDNSGARTESLLGKLNELKKKNPENIKYKVHRRAAKVLHPELYKYPKTLAKDCKL